MRTAQPSLPGLGLGRGRLFPRDVLERYLTEHGSAPLPMGDGGTAVIAEWVNSVAGSSADERTLDPQFLQRIFCGVLGYVPHPLSPCSLYAKAPTRVTHLRGEPDAILGDFDCEPPHLTTVIELKSPGTDLDRPQPGYGNRTPVDQAFDYARALFQVRWVIVSDMLVIRLYAIDSQDDYEQFDLRRCFGPGSEPELPRLHFLLGNQYLNSGAEAPVAKLYGKSASHRVAIRAGFYEAYCEIRADLRRAIHDACAEAGLPVTQAEVIQATQRLLDRLMFIYYCEDHPQSLVPDGTVSGLVDAAVRQLGPGAGKIYEQLKLLFREVDAGSPEHSPLRLAAYDGELFKEHPILDHIQLPDALNRKTYRVVSPREVPRIIQGAWGLHVYDFWTELNEHLMGHIFEWSLSDLDAAVSGAQADVLRWEQRKQHGVFFTTDILSDFLARNVIAATLEEHAPLSGNGQAEGPAALEHRMNYLSGITAVDFACGSGAFLVSVYREMMREFWRLKSALSTLRPGDDDLFSAAQAAEQSDTIRRCVFGVDLLPQAVEIAKLALWLNSVQKDQAIDDLSGQLVVGDSLEVAAVFERLRAGEGAFDIVVGNPPWGAQVDPAVRARCSEALGVSPAGGWDSWELFLLLSIRALREGGRLALLVPDSFFYPEKQKIRRILFEATGVEMVYSLGPDWFGRQVRMGTVALQARRGAPQPDAQVRCMALSGELRRQAIRGEIPLSQVEALRSRTAPRRRTVQSPTFEVEVFRGARDDRIMAQMEGNGIALQTMCERGRGEEINKAGVTWRCPSCQNLTTPGAKLKGGAYAQKQCPHCGLVLRQENVQSFSAVTPCESSAEPLVGFIDGDDISARYAAISPRRCIDLGLLPAPKLDSLYAPPKLLMRQAGVGLLAVLDETSSRCPQSVYIYRLRDHHAREGYRNEFLLAALLSRTMNYFVLKRYAETDPAKAFAKFTHERLSSLPIPRVDFSDARAARTHDDVIANVRSLIAGEALNGGPEDLQIELSLRGLWGIGPEDGAYINGEFYDLPRSQVVAALFPDGAPTPVPDG